MTPTQKAKALEWIESYRKWFSERWPESIEHLNTIRTALTQPSMEDELAEALEKMYSDLRLNTNAYNYQCGFLDAINSVKGFLAKYKESKK